MTSQTMNSIRHNQNQEQILMCLFSQRIMYDKAKIDTYINYGINFIIFFIGTITTKFLTNKPLTLTIGIFECILFILSIIIEKRIEKLNKLAAATQEFIDRSIYEFEINNRVLDGIDIDTIISKANEIKDKYKDKYNIQINNTGEDKPSGVKDWYTNISDDIEKNNAILKCQEQSIYWDKKLMYIYKRLIVGVIIIFIIVFIFINLNNTVEDFLISIFSIFLLTKQIILELQSTKEFIKNSEKLEIQIDTLKEVGFIQENKLKDIQLDIYKRRRSNLNVPSFIYNIINKNLHKEYNTNN